MSAASNILARRPADLAAGLFGSVEFEIALDLQDPVLSGFDRCVREAAGIVGGELLFEMPADGDLEDASRIAAVRITHEGRDTILFAVLDESGTRLRVADRSEIGDRFHGFARAFVGVLERIRDDLAATTDVGTAGTA